jgi:RHS repeat-associated protein
VTGANTSAYVYNGLGDRLSQTVDSVTTNYTLDLNAGLTQVLADGTNTYLYGNGRIGELQPGGFAYHLGDALGSVRQLTNELGVVTLAKSYEPFGNTLTSVSVADTVFQFTGEQRDGATGLTYLRARYLNSSAGRFLTKDAWDGILRQPISLHRWLYVYANPVNLTDSSGHDPWWNEFEPCSGTSYFIAKQPGDGGISQAECWAEQTKLGENYEYACVEGYGCFDLGHAREFGNVKQKWQEFQKSADLAIEECKDYFYIDFASTFRENLGSTIVSYWANAQITEEQLAGVFRGIYLDFSYRFEASELVFGFNAADLPSDYLGGVAATWGTVGRSPESLLYDLGGKVTYYEKGNDPYGGTVLTNFEFTPVELVREPYISAIIRHEWPPSLQVAVINDPNLWGPIAETRSYLYGRIQFHTIYNPEHYFIRT